MPIMRMGSIRYSSFPHVRAQSIISNNYPAGFLQQLGDAMQCECVLDKEFNTTRASFISDRNVSRIKIEVGVIAKEGGDESDGTEPAQRRIGTYQITIYDKGTGTHFRQGSYFHYIGAHPLHDNPHSVHLVSAGPSARYCRQDQFSSDIIFPGIKP